MDGAARTNVQRCRSMRGDPLDLESRDDVRPLKETDRILT
jgi:hypothetical protein